MSDSRLDTIERRLERLEQAERKAIAQLAVLGAGSAALGMLLLLVIERVMDLVWAAGH